MIFLMLIVHGLIGWATPAQAAARDGEQLCVVARLGTGFRFGHSLLVYIDSSRATVHNIESFHDVASDQDALDRLTEIMRGHESVEFSAFCAPLTKSAKDRLDGLISGRLVIGERTLREITGGYNVLTNNCTHMAIHIYRAVTGKTLDIGDGFVSPANLERAIRGGASGYPILSTPREFYDHICREASLKTRIRCQP